MTRREAEQALGEKNLMLGRVTAGSQEGAGPGTVIDQDPKPAAAIPENKRVAIVLQTRRVGSGDTAASGDGIVAVPDVTGRIQADAEDLLRRARLFRGEVTVEVVADRPPGTVVAQDPRPGTRVGEAATVNISVAGSSVPRGSVSGDTSAEVPNVLGQQFRTAILSLERAGYRADPISFVHSPGARTNTVLAQRPPAGQRLARGLAVALVVAKVNP